MATTLTYEEGSSVDTIAFDATTSETHTFDAEVTENAVESGSATNDNVRAKPSSLRLEVMVTDYPLATKGNGIGGAPEKGRAARIFEKLVTLRAQGTRFFVETGARVYENMVLKSVTVPRDKPLTGALRISLMFAEVKIVKSESVPVRLSTVNTKAKPKVDGGKQPTTGTDDATKRKSWAASGFDKASDGLKVFGKALGF
jgi:hypothetical protein